MLQASSSKPWCRSARTSDRTRRHPKWCSHAKVHSMPWRTLPGPEPCAMPRRAIIGVIPRRCSRAQHSQRHCPRRHSSDEVGHGIDAGTPPPPFQVPIRLGPKSVTTGGRWCTTIVIPAVSMHVRPSPSSVTSTLVIVGTSASRTRWISIPSRFYASASATRATSDGTL